MHVNTHAQHLNIVAITEAISGTISDTTSGKISDMTSVMIYLFSMPGLGHLLLHTPALHGGSTLCWFGYRDHLASKYPSRIVTTTNCQRGGACRDKGPVHVAAAGRECGAQSRRQWPRCTCHTRCVYQGASRSSSFRYRVIKTRYRVIFPDIGPDIGNIGFRKIRKRLSSGASACCLYKTCPFW